MLSQPQGVCSFKYLSPQTTLPKPSTTPNAGTMGLPPAQEANILLLPWGPTRWGADSPWGAVSTVSSHLGAPTFLGWLWRQGRFFFFFQSLVALHMVEIKGVAGCMVLLYFQALLLIRKQDQRQY